MNSAFNTDRYEFTMLAAALESGVAHRRATFELFARKLPEGRRYGVVAGVGRALQAIEDFRFSDEQIAYLEETGNFSPALLTYLQNYRFTGTVRGYREGDVYFPHSPILTVEGTFGEAVLLETVLLSILNHDSAVASAASRMVMASERRFPLIEMGSRRTHEDSAVAAARAAYVAGFSSTSNMEAGLAYGVPTTGTSAHAFTLAHSSELEAFQAQVRTLGVGTTLLVDTYDTEQGIRNAVTAGGVRLGGIRIDSGDLVQETFRARRLLDELGAYETKIVLSSDIDEYAIAELVAADAPVDVVGAGTRVVTGSGHPTASMVFKLVEIEDETGAMRPVAKKAEGKASVGGLKTAYRRYRDGLMVEEFYLIRPEDEPEDVQRLTETYMVNGHLVARPGPASARLNHEAVMSTLPPAARELSPGEPALVAVRGGEQ